MKSGGPLRRTTSLRSRSKLRVVDDSDRTTILNNIQALLRDLAIARDGGCVLHHYSESGDCGGRTKRRADPASRAPQQPQTLGLLRRHAQHCVPLRAPPSALQEGGAACLLELMRRHIGEERWTWLQHVIAEKRPYRCYLADWKLAEAALKAELVSYAA